MPTALRPELSVIIPVFNKWDLTAGCLKSLRETTLDHFLQVIVVDNASTDETASQLEGLGRSLFGDGFVRIRNEVNRNFAGASNQGACKAGADMLLFLNNDTVLTPGWLPPLFEEMARPQAPAGTGPLLLYPNDTVQHLGVAFALSGVFHLYGGLPVSHTFVRKKRKFQAITAAALMMPAKTFAGAGMFHEEYVNGFEDVDLCLHLSAAGGFFTCVPQSVVYHLEGQTPGRQDGEANNAHILAARCQHMFYPDAHLHGLRDGLRPFINDVFGFGYDMPASDQQRLMESVQGQPASSLVSALQNNPFWLRGYALLTDAVRRSEAPGTEVSRAWLLHYSRESTVSVLWGLVQWMAAMPKDTDVYDSVATLFSQVREGYDNVPDVYLRKNIGAAECRGDLLLKNLLEKKCEALPSTIKQLAAIEQMLGKLGQLR